MRIFSGGFLAVLLGLTLPAYADVLRYQVTDLGTLGGGSNSDAAGINASGQVTGNSPISLNQYHAFLYSGGAMSDLPTLGGTISYGFAINDDAVVVGRSLTSGNAEVHAFVSDAGANRDLGTLKAGNAGYSAAYGLNAAGLIVGEAESATGIHAFRYSYPFGNSMTDLGTLPGGTTSAAYDVNASSTVIVGSSNRAAGGTHAVSFSFGSVVDLGTLPGGTNSLAQAINDNFQITGSSEVLAASGLIERHVILFDGNATIVDLGTLGGSTAYGMDINNGGVIVGHSETANGGPFHAFISQGRTLVDLNPLQLRGSGWLLSYAAGINDAGQITGTGTNPAGNDHAFLLTPVTVKNPTVAIAGKKKITTTKKKRAIKGTAGGDVTSVTYRVGKKGGFKEATGLAGWSFTAKLKRGKNVITVISRGDGGDSVPATILVTRK